MSTATILAVDPGGTWTGMVLRRGTELLDHAVVHRGAGAACLDLDGWVAGVLEQVQLMVVGAAQRDVPVDAAAVEQTVAPRGHARGRPGHLIDPGPAIDTAHVGGAVLGWAWSDAVPTVLVAPGRHGQPAGLDLLPVKAARKALEAAYPAELVGARTTRGTGDRLRHCRSAWDVAGAAAVALRARRVRDA